MNDKEKHSAHLINIMHHPEGGDAVYELLQHIVKMLDALLKEDEPGHIDLGKLGLTLEERDLLMGLLGENGTRAEVFDYGRSQISATGIPGVWWVHHLDAMGQVIGEFIEVNYCPEVLIAANEDVREGRDALKARLFEAEMVRKRRNPET